MLWEQLAKQLLPDAGRVERIDRRTLTEQGIRRAPQVNEGPNNQAMHERGYSNRAVRRRGVPPTSSAISKSTRDGHGLSIIRR
jgi:MobA/MobL family